MANISSKAFLITSPQVMGILNATPDSFSDGGKFNVLSSALDQIEKMIKDGASIIDVGGESTQPNADPVSEAEELRRVLPILEKAVPSFPDTLFSIDTTKYEVAKRSLDFGAHILNDVSGLEKEPRFIDVCVEYNATYILMHAQGDPKNMQLNPRYDDVVAEVSSFFEAKSEQLKAKGVAKIILDPGIGFGKALDHNLSLIAHLDKFKKFGLPILVGASRKSMIGQLLDGRPTKDRLAGTIAVHYHSLMQGANILRVHDVKEAYDSIRIFNSLPSQS